MNTLTVTYHNVVKVGTRVYFWVWLETETETRSCCYSRYNGSWSFEDGDSEPEMSIELRVLFHSKKGDAAINKCYKTGETVTLKA